MVDQPPDSSPRPSTVLIVEDEVLIRMMVVESLADIGCAAIEADSGRTALQALGEAKEEIRAAILDIGLPDVSGEALIEKIRAVVPGMPIILTTGYDVTDLRRKYADDPNTRILGKPYQPDMLDNILKEWGIAKG